MRFMGRTYVKIFLLFWLVTILTLVGSNVVVHLLGLGPDKYFTQSDPSLTGPGARLLREFVSDAVNSDQKQLGDSLRSLPSWATKYFYLIDNQDKDILDRELPPQVRQFSERISSEHPTLHDSQSGHTYFGRQFMLSDGTVVRLVVLSSRDNILLWKLYINNFGHILLMSMVISGLVCFFLARYITRDIRTLKVATQEIARGNWDTRVAKELRNRPGEVADLGRAFDDMVVKLQRTMHEQRRLIKDVSHELRTPLARLQVALAIAQKRANTEIRDELERIKQAADYLNDVISNILSLPLTEQDTWELDDVVEVCSMVAVIAKANQDEANTKGVTLVVHDDLNEALVQTRGNTLAGVFDNVIRNAVRYTASNTPVSVSLTPASPGFCTITISDRGPGVKPEQLEDIFEPFFRTDEARCRQKGGYGLGLAIAKRTVELHGGTIKAELNRFGGLSVIIKLPAAEAVSLISDRAAVQSA